jgi:hypothetical protein
MAGMVIDWMRTIIKKFPQQAEERGLPRVVKAWDGGQEKICLCESNLEYTGYDKGWSILFYLIW